MNNRRYVHCKSGMDGEEVDQWVERSLCLLEVRPGCSICPNSQFEVLFQDRIVDQVVACPRWQDEERYVFVQRGVCLTQRPFAFCHECPNSKPSELPRSSIGWLEEEERQNRIEQELDEEELDE